MNSIKQRPITERGMNMKRTHLIAVLVGIVAMGIFAADASAMYHPGMGTFMQRDPGAGGAHRIGAGGPAVGGGFVRRDPTGSNQYADGMNLYQYVRSNPTGLTDAFGLNAGPCTVKQVSGPDGDGSFGPHGVRKRNIWRPSRTIKDESGVKHKVGHTWISCGTKSYGFYPQTYKDTLKGGRSRIPGLHGADPTVKNKEDEHPQDPLEGNDSEGNPIQPDWIWTTEVPERPDGPGKHKLQAESRKGTLCCKATDRQITDCVEAVARSWGGTKWRLDRHCQDMVVDILDKCCMTAPKNNREIQPVRQRRVIGHGGWHSSGD